jgi:ubiquinone/menaquinone biosynthesis C-methylase UbiE
VRWREAGARQKADNVERVCAENQVTSAIENGCGTGTVLKRLQELKFAKHFACMDVSYSSSSVTFARNVCRNFISSACVASAKASPFRNAAFDVAILSHSIEHLHEPAQALAEPSRIARYIAVEVPTEVVLSNAQCFGKSGLRLAKPMVKQALKTLLPAALYTRVLTSHSTFLCKRAGT